MGGMLSAQTLTDELVANADIIVDQNGNGDYLTIQEGINAIPDFNSDWLILLIRKGVYYEKVIMNYKKTKVIIVGEDVDSTIITHDDWGDKMLVDGNPAVGGHTFSTYTFRADPNDIQVYNMTFENPTRNGQGVAYHSNGDRQLLYHVKMLGYQDTYFDNFRTRRYMKDCYIEGATDYIFGFGVTLFDSCQINVVSSGYITASSTPQYYEFGHVFKDCRVTSSYNVTGGIYLGRPWFPYSNTIFYECWLDNAIADAGWSTWSGRENTCIYREYNNFGPGSDTADRIWFGHQLNPSLADRYNIDTILAASNFPSDMGPEVDSIELFSMRDRFEASGYVARADTILYAGRDTFPEYPTDNWKPEFYTPIFDIINTYTVPFMDSINGKIEIGNIFWDGNPLEGFQPELTDYVIEYPADDTVFPVFTMEGNGILSTSYPASMPGYATVTITSKDKVSGNAYKIYISQDSSYWSTVPEKFIINYTDTILVEKGKTYYESHLPEDYTNFKYAKIIGRYTGQRSSYEKPAQVPGDLLITITSVGGTETELYTVRILWPLGVQEKLATPGGIDILSPVYDVLRIRNTTAMADVMLQIFDLNGRLVISEQLEKLDAGIVDIAVDGQALPSGVYLYSISSDKRHARGKFIKTSN